MPKAVELLEARHVRDAFKVMPVCPAMMRSVLPANGKRSCGTPLPWRSIIGDCPTLIPRMMRLDTCRTLSFCLSLSRSLSRFGGWRGLPEADAGGAGARGRKGG